MFPRGSADRQNAGATPSGGRRTAGQMGILVPEDSEFNRWRILKRAAALSRKSDSGTAAAIPRMAQSSWPEASAPKPRFPR